MRGMLLLLWGRCPACERCGTRLHGAGSPTDGAIMINLESEQP